FPVTKGTVQQTTGTNTDAFVVKLSGDGSTLFYGTYLGGSDSDQAFGIAVDNTGNAYITGRTDSGNYPISAGVFQTGSQGLPDAFVTVLNPSATVFIYSTLLGGEAADQATGIAVDSSFNAYVTGNTSSLSYPTTNNSFQPGGTGTQGAFVTKLNPA